MTYTLEINWSLARTEDGWEPSPAWRRFPELSRAVRALRLDADLARVVCDLRVVDENGKVYAVYETEKDMRLPGCRWRAIERNAYCLWEAAGKPESNGVEFWLRAESEIDENQNGVLVYEQAEHP
jgi:hypothetical protein